MTASADSDAAAFASAYVKHINRAEHIVELALSVAKAEWPPRTLPKICQRHSDVQEICISGQGVLRDFVPAFALLPLPFSLR